MLFRALALLVFALPALPTFAQGRPDLIPPSWTMQDEDRATRTRRFVSPDGRASLVARQIAADPTARGRDLDRIGYRNDEQVTYHRRERTWIAISGYRGGEIFYRKINLACRGTRWHLVEFTYPRDLKRRMDAIVTHAAHGMTSYSDDCGREASSGASD
jgi:hypothetical protein